MMQDRYELTIPGWTPDNPQSKTVNSPYDGGTIAEIELLDREGMEHALEIANRAFRESTLPAHMRADVLKRLSTLIVKHHEDLSMCIAREGGKPLFDARIEVTRAANTVQLAAEEATRIHGREIPMEGSAAALGRLAFTTREPIGVTAAISAFNHPVNLIAHQVATAVAAGCPVLVKPASNTPLSCIQFVQLLHEAGLPPELCMAVPCRPEVAEVLVASRRIAFFSFIGSAELGWRLRSILAPGVRCALEHGGSAPLIVDRDVELDRVIPALLKGGYYHAGQVCVSVQRVFAHQTVKDPLARRLAEGADKLIVGDPTLENTDVGPLINDDELDRVHAMVTKAIDAGATCLTGARSLPNHCYAPTVLLDPPLDTDLMTGEIFGPVIAVKGFDTLESAVRMANDVQWSFQSAVFSRDIDRAMSAAKALEAAAVMINDHTAFRVDWMPFGGRRISGLGVGGVGPAIEELTQEKLIVVKINEVAD